MERPATIQVHRDAVMRRCGVGQMRGGTHAQRCIAAVAHYRIGQQGLTLVDAVVGLAIFVVVVLPVMQYAARLATSPKVSDLQMACVIMDGECDVIYKNRVLPDSVKVVEGNGKKYEVICEHEPDTGLVSWTLIVRTARDTIAGVNGLVHMPGSRSMEVVLR